MEADPVTHCACNCTECNRCVGADANMLALLRRDWAVRVLDAWADRECYACFLLRGPKAWQVCGENFLTGRTVFEAPQADSPDAARLAAAKAIYPTLSDTVRAQLGEAP